jgi:hypothetical protein
MVCLLAPGDYDAGLGDAAGESVAPGLERKFYLYCQ